MSGYNGRRGPNVSQYVANLNTVVPEDIQATSPDFSMFLDNDLFNDSLDSSNIDFNSSLDVGLTNIESAPMAPQANRTLPAASANDANLNFDIDNNDFSFGDFTFPSAPLSLDPSLNHRPYNVNTYTSPTSSTVSPLLPTFDASGAPSKKRKASAPLGDDLLDASTSPSNPLHHPTDESARHAAEEDKRRRNTAASARFRIKKKQREQALEKTAKEMTERVSVLETRIQQLETENTWLKGLITEKNGGKTSAGEIAARLSQRERGERSSAGRTDGVGTAGAGAAGEGSE